MARIIMFMHILDSNEVHSIQSVRFRCEVIVGFVDAGRID